MNTVDFIRESNRIEGILRDPTKAEIAEFRRFMDLKNVTVEDLQNFVSVYQPNAVLRDRKGLDVRVGRHIAPLGGPAIRQRLEILLDRVNGNLDTAYETHLIYEKLHPFTDGNGRSGRALWAWQYRDLCLGFLHRFYYQALGASKEDAP